MRAPYRRATERREARRPRPAANVLTAEQFLTAGLEGLPADILRETHSHSDSLGWRTESRSLRSWRCSFSRLIGTYPEIMDKSI